MELIASAPWRDGNLPGDVAPRVRGRQALDGPPDAAQASTSSWVTKYWTMTECSEIDLDADDYVLNRALLYRDRRDFVIRRGDTGKRET